MSFRKVGSWFTSEAGKTFAFVAATAGGIGGFCLVFVPNTFLISQYKDLVHLYKNGVTAPLPKHLIERFNKAIDLAQIKANTEKFYSVFPVVGFDIFSAGSAHSKYGCVIGLPVNFTYDSVETIDKSNIKILSESVVWSSKAGQEFLESQVLSEKAQLYAIAREVRMTQTLKLFLDSMYASSICLLTYGATNTLNARFNLFAKTRSIRLTMYVLVGTFVLTNYMFIKDFTQLHYEQKVDEELKHMDPILTEGAIEFYTKLLQRNRALRKLMGSEGESMYSVLGNENYLFRTKHLPLLQRKAYFENTLDPKESLIKNVM